MPDGPELFRGLAADALGGRIRREELGMPGFEILELAHELVVRLIGDGRLREDVVPVIVGAQLLPQLFDPLKYRTLGACHQSAISRAFPEISRSWRGSARCS